MNYVYCVCLLLFISEIFALDETVSTADSVATENLETAHNNVTERVVVDSQNNVTEHVGCELCEYVLTTVVNRIEAEKGAETESLRTIYFFIREFLAEFQGFVRDAVMGESADEQWISFWDHLQVSWEDRVDSMNPSNEQSVLLHALWNEIADWLEEAVEQKAGLDETKTAT